MALNSLGLGFVFSARDLASAPIRRLSGTFGMLGRATSGFGQTMRRGMGSIRTAGIVMAAAGGLGTAAAFSLARASGAFEQGLARVAGVTRASTTEMAALRDAAIEVGITTSFSPDQAVEGLTSLATMGFQASEAMNLLTPATDLAEGGLIGLADAASAVASATRVFGLNMREARGSADQMLRVTQLTALRAEDLSLALGTVGRGAGQTSQGLGEMLIAMGLVRNTGVEASVAASSVSAALQHMASNASKFREANIDITNDDGSFRNYLDIIRETQEHLSGITDQAERAAAARDLFGRFGVSSFNAVSTQLATGIRGAEGELLRGADAIDYLRSQMADAEGTAESFRRLLLDTFPGQLRLLQGSLQTLAVVLGENFARAFRPMVEGIIGIVNRFIAVWNDLPDEMRNGIATAVVALSVLTGAMGMVLVVGASLGIMALAWKAIAIGAVAAIAALTPLIAAVATVFVAFQVLSFAARENLGGVGDTFRRMSDMVRLTWAALTSLFSRGGFTKALSEELGRAENGSIRGFAISVFMIWHRLKLAWTGLVRGVTAGMLTLGPAFERLQASFGRLLAAFGIGRIRAEELGTALPGSEFERFGEQAGLVMSQIIEGAIDVIKWFTDLSASVVSANREMSASLSSAFEEFEAGGLGGLIVALGHLVVAMWDVIEATGLLGVAWDAITSLGGTILSIVLLPFTVMLTPLRMLIEQLTRMFRVFGVAIAGFRSGAGFMIRLLGGHVASGPKTVDPSGTFAGRIDRTFGDQAAQPAQRAASAREESLATLRLLERIAAQNATTTGEQVLLANIHIDGERVSEQRVQMERTENVARGRPPEPDR